MHYWWPYWTDFCTSWKEFLCQQTNISGRAEQSILTRTPSGEPCVHTKCAHWLLPHVPTTYLVLPESTFYLIPYYLIFNFFVPGKESVLTTYLSLLVYQGHICDIRNTQVRRCRSFSANTVFHFLGKELRGEKNSHSFILVIFLVINMLFDK